MPVVAFHILTIFPEMFRTPMSEGIVARALDKGLLKVDLHNPRDKALGRHRMVDDYAFGGGPGMIMKPEPIFETVEDIRASIPDNQAIPIVLLTPQGRNLTQQIVEELVFCPQIVLICGRYGGVDERVRQYLVTDEISIGDYILSGGEIAAMVLVDAISRLVPGVVGSEESTSVDSFTTGMIQHPQYTRPAKFRNWEVPNLLLSGNHTEIALWRRRESLRRTVERRPDLLDSIELSEDERIFIEDMGHA